MRFEDVGKMKNTNNKIRDIEEEKDNIRQPMYVRKQEMDIVDDRNSFDNSALKQMNFSIFQRNLGNCLNVIDDEVMKGYVTRLQQLPIITQNAEVYRNLKDIHFFKISELVYQEDEFSVDKLAMVFSALSSKPCTLVLMLKSDGIKTDFYLGARPNDNRSAGTLFQMLKQSLLGFFPGSKISDYYDEDMKKDMQSLNVGCISSVTSVADYKQDQDITNKEFIQGLEKFVYAMQGKSYTSMFIADNISYDELMIKKREYEQIYTQISPFVNMQMNFSVSDSKSEANGVSDGKTTNFSYTGTKGSALNENVTKTHGISENESEGITVSENYTNTHSKSEGNTHTKGYSDGESRTVTNGVNTGIYVGTSSKTGLHGGISMGYNHSVANGTNHTNSVSDSVSQILTHGFSDSQGRNESKTIGKSRSESNTKGIGVTVNESNAYTEGEAFNLVNSQTLTDTFGTSKAITLNAENMTLKLMMQKLEKHLERIEECESFGMWNFAAYFLGESAAETETAASTYKSVVVGTDSGIERNAINSWSDSRTIDELKQYLYHFLHPQFRYSGFSYEGERYTEVNPCVLVSTNELAIHMGLPKHSVRGLPVVGHASFGQEVINRKSDDAETIYLGKIHNLGQDKHTEVSLDLNSLAMHTFITGSTGSGKSNAVYNVLTEVRKKKIPFLVIEPAKGEYKNVFTDIKCYGTNSLVGEILQINPFSFPKGIHVLEHIDRIVEIFNVCWPMYAAMPAVLKDSIENAYKSAGWDLNISENEKVEGLFPTFEDVLIELNKTINSSEYSNDTKGDYIGSLSTRIKSLTNGINGQVFTSNEMNLADLFDRDAIIDISRVGSVETKSLIMGLVVMKLQEYRIAHTNGMNSPLRHITVLEEAHNLLKKTSTEQGAESSNLVGKSVEMLTNAIAEIRTFGEGFVIVDQAPNLLDTAVIRNTNTKIVLRLPEYNDREIVGNSIALQEQQFDELSKLPTGVAAVYQNDWQEAVLCRLPKYETFDSLLSKKSEFVPVIKRAKVENNELLHLLIGKDLKGEQLKILKDKIIKSNVAAKVRKDLIVNMNSKNAAYEWAVADFIKKNYDLSDVFLGTQKENWKNLSDLCDIMISNLQNEFYDFNEEEIYTILYYVCRIEHELYPKYQIIEKLRVEYLKEMVM